MIDHNYLYFRPLEQNDVVLILGATHGDFIREYRNEILEKNVFVINVEPTLEGVFHLADYIKRNMPENACVLSCALADNPKIMSMDIRDNLITSTLEDRPETNERWPMRLLYKQKVPVLNLDNIIDMAGFKITKVFADIEGSELEVFMHSETLNTIPYIAIAAYHMRDGKPTHEKLTKHFGEFYKEYKIMVTGEPSRQKHEVVFFAMKEG